MRSSSSGTAQKNVLMASIICCASTLPSGDKQPRRVSSETRPTAARIKAKKYNFFFHPSNYSIFLAYIRAPICTVRAENCRAAPAARCASGLCCKTENKPVDWAGAKEPPMMAGQARPTYRTINSLAISFSGGMYFLAVCGCSSICCTSWRKASHLGPCLIVSRWMVEWVGGSSGLNLAKCNVILTRQLDQPHRQRSRVAVHPCSVAAMASRVCQVAKDIHI